MSIIRHTASRAAVLLTSTTFMFGFAASAQNVSSQASAEAQDTGIQDIVVTAQRRAESAQDVPISLQSFNAEALDRTAVRNTEDLTAVVGGMIIQPSAARPTVFVRGVGTNSSNTTPAVLTFVDGVYYPFGQSTELVNVSSVEVLKGPQGTLFGRNATGGVIQITTVPPSETLGAKVEIGYGNYDTVDTMGYLTGGLANGVAMDLSLRYSNQGNGFGTNVFNGDDVFFTNKFAGRTRLRADISDVTNLTLAADYSTVRGTVGTNVSPAAGYGTLFIAGAIRRRGPGEFFPGTYDVNAGPRSPSFRAKEWGLSGTLETEFSGITLRSITSYRESEEHIFIDFDGGPASTINLTIDREPRTSMTQELQLLSASEGPFEWVTGAFYYKGKARIAGFELNAQEANSLDIDESIAGYAQGSYEFLPGTKLTLGGRYTVETRSIDGFVTVNGITDPARSGRDKQKFKEPTWRIALDHNLSKDAMIYASVSRGFNAGFFNQSSLAGFATRTQNPPVLPEFLTAYEIGAKTDFLDRRLRINLSAFKYDYKGLQQQIYDQGAVKTINAGSAEIKGLDFEITALPVSSLTLSMSGTLLDSKYKSYPLAPDYVPQPNGSIIAGGNVDAKGNTITNAPKISYTASVSHVLSTAIGEFTTSANLNYRGKTWVDPANRFKLPTRFLLNLTERYTDPSGNYFITIWAKNLLDKHYDYAINILTPAGLVGNVAPPRTYGASIGFEF